MKDYILYETEFPKNIPLKVLTPTEPQRMLHHHSFLEITYIEKGLGKFIISGKTYEISSGDFFIINNKEKHIATYEGNYSLKVIIFDPKLLFRNDEWDGYFAPFFARNKNFNHKITFSDEKSYSVLEELFFSIVSEYNEEKDGWQAAAKAKLVCFLTEIYRFTKSKNLLSENRNINKKFDKIKPIIDFIHHNYNIKITLDIISEKTFISKSYMCTCFKDVMSISIINYINNVRITHACFLLKTTDNILLNIALETGFTSESYFNKVFKNITGLTPSEYRRKSKYITIF